jgi:hypothetical protein
VKLVLRLIGRGVLLLLSTVGFQLSTGLAQSTAFSYQGRLDDGANPASGLYDLRFSIYDSAGAGSVVAGPLTNSALVVNNGSFVATVDFGAAAFNGADRWLEIGVRTNGDAGAVSDAQLPGNVARLDAANQVFSGAVNFNNASNSFSGNFSGNGAGLSHVALGALFTTNRTVIGWPTGFGVTTIPPSAFDVVSVKAGSSHALALRADGVVVGWGGALPAVVPAAATNIAAISAGGNHSLALRANGTLLAWGVNTFGQTNVPPGATNVIAVVAGNNFSIALRADGKVVAWGEGASGQTNIPTRATNVIAIAAGGAHALAVRADGTVVGWGSNSAGQTNPPASATNVIAVAAGPSHSLGLRADGTVVGWGDNSFGQITIPPAATNVVAISAPSSSLDASMALRADGTVLVWGNGSVTNVPPAASNVVAIALGAGYALALRVANGTPPFALLDRPNVFSGGLTAPSLASPGAFDLSAGGMRVLRLEPDQGVSSAGNLIGGYIGNSISANSFSGGNTIAGGGYSGGPNSILDNSRGNFIGAGSGNQIGPNVNDSFIGGGFGNIIYATHSMIVGGYSNLVDFNADSSFAAGFSAQALHPGSFVWADNHFGNSFASTAPHQFSVRASGGVRLVAQLPLSEWSYKEDAATRHIGPMAQDFYSAFNVGTDDRHIAPIDEGGVALAAIQGLNQKLEKKLEQKQTEIAELKERLHRLEQIIHSSGGGK